MDEIINNSPLQPLGRDAQPETPQEVPQPAPDGGFSPVSGPQQPTQNGAFPPPYVQQPYGYYYPQPISQPQYAPRPQKKKPAFELDKRDLIYAACIAASALFGVVAGLWGGLRAGFGAAFLLNLILMSCYLAKNSKRPPLFGVLCGVLSAATAPVYALTTNGQVRFCSVLCGSALSVLWFWMLSGKTVPGGDLGAAAVGFDALTETLGGFPAVLRGIFTGKSTRMKRLYKALLGVLCAIPVLCAVVPLLIRSDAAFEGMVSSVIANVGTVIAQLIVTAILAPLCVSFAVTTRKKSEPQRHAYTGKGLDTVFLCAFLCVLSVVYIVYLFSQLAYFFNGFRGLLPEGYAFSYAEYARRGFFELCAVAAINMVLLFAAVLLSRKREGRLPIALRAAGTFIALFTLLLIGTAMAKLALYVQNYGMTVQRLNAGALMVFMAAVFAATLLRLFTPRVKVLQVAAIAAAVVLLTMGLGNINRIAAEYNYSAYVSGKLEVIDVKYLADLGAEGVPYLVRLLEDETQPEKLREQASSALYEQCINLYKNKFDVEKSYGYGYTFETPLTAKGSKPSQFNLPEKHARDAIEAYLKDHRDFLINEDMKYAENGWAHRQAEETP